MLKLRKRFARFRTAEDVADPLQIRNLLDDPRLQALMGVASDETIVAPTPTFSHDPIVTVGVSFGHRPLVDRAA